MTWARGWGHGFYLCGCKIGQRAGYPGNRVDPGGFDVCVEHGVRRYGWASNLLVTPNGLRHNYKNEGRGGSGGISDTVRDRRDNSDPEEVGRALLSRRNGGNGGMVISTRQATGSAIASASEDEAAGHEDVRSEEKE
jgi:hypothetical protein